MTQQIIVYGPEGSPYVRSVRMALQEKGLAHQLVQLPPEAYKSDDYLSERHPFGKIPAVEIDGFRIYETQAVLRLIDELHPEPSLQPSSPFERARMNQILGIVDCYGWPAWGGGILLNRFIRPLFGQEPIEAEVEAALPNARISVRAIADLQSQTRPYLCGDRLSFADLIVYNIMTYFQQTPEGAPIIAGQARFATWLEMMTRRQSGQELLAA